MYSLKGMDQIVPDDRSRYEDLTLFGVCAVFNDDVTELYGGVDSESDNNETEQEIALENYVIQTNSNVSSQSMAHTKQMAGRSQNTVPIASTQAAIKDIVQSSSSSSSSSS